MSLNRCRQVLRAGVWLAATTLTACAVGPDFVRPTVAGGDRYTPEEALADTVPAEGRSQRFTAGARVPGDWWTLFESPSLDQVIRAALAGNPTLRAADASLRASEDNLRAGYGVFFPHVNIAADASRERVAPATQGLATPAHVYNLVTASGSVGYALDVFGGQRRTVEELGARVDVQRNLRTAAYIALTANVVNTCIARAGYAAEISSLENLIALQEQQLRAARVRSASGTAPYTDVLSLQGLVAASQALLAPFRQRLSQSEHLLATLEGVAPTQVTLPQLDITALRVPADLPVSLPSELVRQRPDILASEADLHAASAGIGVATAAMFPSFTLNGTYGAAGLRAAALSAPAARFWSVGPSLRVPLFQGGSLWYGRKSAVEGYRQAQAVYRQTVLNAFAQVADSLTALGRDAESLQAQSLARRAAADALALVQANYEAGLVAYVDVLAADVQFHQTTVAWIQAIAQRQQDTVALYVALGGGWWNAPPAGTWGTAP